MHNSVPDFAAPDDDAPRFAWANAVGGERGELVAIQCALARAPLRLDLAIERRRREAELLERFGEMWSGLGGLAQGWRFRRGFVDFAQVDATVFVERGAELFQAAPLLTRVELLGLHDVELAEIARRLDAVIASPAFARLRGLRLDRIGNTVEADSDVHPHDFRSAGGPALVRLIESGALRNLRSLELPRCALSSSEIKQLAACPDATNLVELDIRHQAVDRYMGLYPDSVSALLASPHLAKLESLDVAGSLGHAAWLAGQTRKERAQASFEQAKKDPELLSHPRILRLRRLGIAYGGFVDAMIDAIANASFERLEWLDLSRNDLFADDLARFGAAAGLARVVELVFDGPSKYVFTAKMAEGLASVTRFDALRTLRLRNCYMSVDAAEILLRSPLAKRLETIDLRGNDDVARKANERGRTWADLFGGILLVG